MTHETIKTNTSSRPINVIASSQVNQSFVCNINNARNNANVVRLVNCWFKLFQWKKKMIQQIKLLEFSANSTKKFSDTYVIKANVPINPKYHAQNQWR